MRPVIGETSKMHRRGLTIRGGKHPMWFCSSWTERDWNRCIVRRPDTNIATEEVPFRWCIHKMRDLNQWNTKMHTRMRVALSLVCVICDERLQSALNTLTRSWASLNHGLPTIVFGDDRRQPLTCAGRYIVGGHIRFHYLEGTIEMCRGWALNGS